MVSDSGGTETFVRTVADFTAGKPQPVSLVCVLREVQAALWQWSWRRTIDWEPASVRIATLTESGDRQADTDGEVSTQQETSITNEVTIEPDLARLGLFVQHAITEWEEQSNSRGSLVVCLDSVEPLLESYTSEQVFKFLFLVEERTKLAGADFLVGIDPHTVDVETYLLLKPVVDVVVGTQKDTLSARR